MMFGKLITDVSARFRVGEAERLLHAQGQGAKRSSLSPVAEELESGLWIIRTFWTFAVFFDILHHV